MNGVWGDTRMTFAFGGGEGDPPKADEGGRVRLIWTSILLPFRMNTCVI